MASSDSSVVAASAEGAPCGSLRLVVDKDSISKENIYSQPIEVGGMQWRSYVRMNEKNETNYLAVFLSHAGGDYIVHSVNAEIVFKIINHQDDTKTVTCEYFERTFDKKIVSWGSFDSIVWNNIDEGFVKDGKLNMEVDFSLWNIIGFRKNLRMDFTDSSDPCHDIALVIEGEKIYVNKGHLSIHSPVFKSMFYGDSVEKNENEIELKDIDRKGFVEMLNVIYPHSYNITDANFEYLLKLGDRFHIDLVLNQVETFLITYAKLTVSSKLVFAGRYRLFALQGHCIDQLATINDVTALKKSRESKYFSDAINSALLDKIVKLNV